MKIKVIDSIMGSGKTSAAINYMNEEHSKRFLYITPYLDEVARVVEACNTNRCEEDLFYEPDISAGTKKRSLKSLIARGKNIATTHSMFTQFDDEIMELISSWNYELILDEVANVVQPYKDVSDYDKEILFRDFVVVGDKGSLIWTDDEYYGEFDEIKNLCKLGSLSVYGEKMLMLWLMPIKAFSCFNKVTILTFLFKGQLQKYYYDLYDINYTYGEAYQDESGEYKFKNVDEPTVKILDKSLFDIYQGESLNLIGYQEKYLSKGWYTRMKKNNSLAPLKNHCCNYATKIIGATSSEIAWTTFKDFKAYCKGKGYTKGFIPSNMRASNNYRTRTVGMYLVNKYVNPILINYFKLYGVEIDQDAYALSEMLQWIWRLAIRDGKPIKLYIPSRRMRSLLQNWLNSGEIFSDFSSKKP